MDRDRPPTVPPVLDYSIPGEEKPPALERPWWRKALIELVRIGAIEATFVIALTLIVLWLFGI